MTSLLTSSGLSAPALIDWTKKSLQRLKPKRAVIITTADHLKEKDEWAQFSYKQLMEIGLPHVDFFDFEQQSINALTDDTFLFVNGGNTFRLMHAMAQQNMRGYLDQFFARNGAYIGVSAGSAVMGSRIDFLSRIGMDPDEHEWGNKPALGYFHGLILPHAGKKWSPPMTALNESNVLEIIDCDAVVLNPLTGFIDQHFKAS